MLKLHFFLHFSLDGDVEVDEFENLVGFTRLLAFIELIMNHTSERQRNSSTGKTQASSRLANDVCGDLYQNFKFNSIPILD